MSRMSRREWHRMMIGGVAAAAARPWRALGAHGEQVPTSSCDSCTGVTIGVQSYSFRDRPLDAAIEGMKTDGLTACELWQGHVEPKGGTREDLRKWRLSTPLSTFTE